MKKYTHVYLRLSVYVRVHVVFIVLFRPEIPDRIITLYFLRYLSKPYLSCPRNVLIQLFLIFYLRAKEWLYLGEICRGNIFGESFKFSCS